MFEKTLVSVSVAAAAVPMAVSADDAPDFSVQVTKRNSCAGKSGCNLCAGKKEVMSQASSTRMMTSAHFTPALSQRSARGRIGAFKKSRNESRRTSTPHS